MDAPAPEAATGRHSARLVLALQYATIAIFVFGAVVPLLVAAIGTGDLAGIADPGLERYGDPKDWLPVPGPDSVWNPLWWLVLVCYLAVMTAAIVPLAVLAAAAGVYRLLARDRPTSRATRVWLLAGTVLAVVIAVLMVTPYGAQLRYWLLD